jgi:hypothetical protein
MIERDDRLRQIRIAGSPRDQRDGDLCDGAQRRPAARRALSGRSRDVALGAPPDIGLALTRYLSI